MIATTEVALDAKIKVQDEGSVNIGTIDSESVLKSQEGQETGCRNMSFLVARHFSLFALVNAAFSDVKVTRHKSRNCGFLARKNEGSPGRQRRSTC